MILFITILVLNCSKINLNLNTNYKEFEIEKELISVIKEDNIEEFKRIVGNNLNKCLDIDNNTSLHYCSQFNSLKIAKFLLNSENVDINIRPIKVIQGKKIKKPSPLHIACYQGHDNMVKLLIEKGADCNIQACKGYSPCYYAVMNNSKACLELLINEKNVNTREKENGASLIYYAALSNNKELVKWLKEKGANIDLYDFKGYTALHRAIIEESPTALEILIKNGADTNLRGNFGVTSLYLAARRSNFNQNVKKIIELLLASGRYINEESQNKIKPLSAAISSNNISLAKFLIDKNAKFDEHDLVVAINNDNRDLTTLLLAKMDPKEIDIRLENFHYRTLIDAMLELKWDLNNTIFKEGLNILQALSTNCATKKELLYAIEKGANKRLLVGQQLIGYNKIYSSNQ